MNDQIELSRRVLKTYISNIIGYAHHSSAPQEHQFVQLPGIDPYTILYRMGTTKKTEVTSYRTYNKFWKVSSNAFIELI